MIHNLSGIGQEPLGAKPVLHGLFAMVRNVPAHEISSIRVRCPGPFDFVISPPPNVTRRNESSAQAVRTSNRAFDQVIVRCRQRSGSAPHEHRMLRRPSPRLQLTEPSPSTSLEASKLGATARAGPPCDILLETRRPAGPSRRADRGLPGSRPRAATRSCEARYSREISIGSRRRLAVLALNFFTLPAGCSIRPCRTPADHYGRERSAKQREDSIRHTRLRGATLESPRVSPYRQILKRLLPQEGCHEVRRCDYDGFLEDSRSIL